MFIKRFKKKCDVRGCKNTTDVFVISKRREMSNTIAICRDCLTETLKDIESYAEPIKVVQPIKPLFPHPEVKVTMSSVAVTTEPEPEEVIEVKNEDESVATTEDAVAEEPIIEEPKPIKTATNKPKPKKKK